MKNEVLLRDQITVRVDGFVCESEDRKMCKTCTVTHVAFCAWGSASNFFLGWDGC